MIEFPYGIADFHDSSSASEKSNIIDILSWSDRHPGIPKGR